MTPRSTSSGGSEEPSASRDRVPGRQGRGDARAPGGAEERSPTRVARNVNGQEPVSTGSGRFRVLFDIGHPAQVHLFRNAIAELERLGHATFVASREKELTVDLLDAYGIDHEPLTTRGEGVASLVGELLLREVRLLSVARRFDPDVIVSRLGPASVHVSKLVGSRNVVVSDTHTDSNPLRWLVSRATLPFVDTICRPPGFDLPVAPARQRPLDFQELAYLHPNYFTPDPSVLAEYGVPTDEPFFVVRLAGWDAYHDVGHRGLSPAVTQELVSFLAEHGVVYVSSEGDLPPAFEDHRLPTPPEAIHQVLYHADLYVGDSGTMASEAAILGTPAVRTNTMAGEDDENVFVELERRYGLIRSFADERRALSEVKRLVTAGADRDEWRRRRERLVEEQVDVTAEMVEVILESAGRA